MKLKRHPLATVFWILLCRYSIILNLSVSSLAAVCDPSSGIYSNACSCASINFVPYWFLWPFFFSPLYMKSSLQVAKVSLNLPWLRNIFVKKQDSSLFLYAALLWAHLLYEYNVPLSWWQIGFVLVVCSGWSHLCKHLRSYKQDIKVIRNWIRQSSVM